MCLTISYAVDASMYQNNSQHFKSDHSVSNARVTEALIFDRNATRMYLGQYAYHQ